MIINVITNSNKKENLDTLLYEMYPGCKILSSSIIKVEYHKEYKYSKSFKIQKDGLLIFHDRD